MTTASPAATRFGSGHAVRRIEDQVLLTGKGRYADDFAPANMVRVAFLRSPYPHARILSMDTSAAKGMPGVHAVITGADLVAAGLKPMDPGIGFPRADGTPASTPWRHILAHEQVRYVGEPMAVVVADTLEQARNAVEAIAFECEDLPFVVDMVDALKPDAPRLSGAPDNICSEMHHGSAEATTKAFAGAAHVVRLDINNQRVIALSLEPRSVLAYPDTETGRLTVRLSTQMPTGVRGTVSGLLGLKPVDVRVLVEDVGGGFGMKTGAYAEDAVIAYCAKLLNRPVKWIGERSEEFLNSYHGRDVLTHAELALAGDGKILGLRVHSLANVGAYATGTGVAIQLLIGPWVQTSIYDIQTIDFQYKAVLTNTASTGAYRGAGRPEAIFIMERLMDEAARQTGIDRVALRRRNMITPAQMPYKNPMAQVYDTGNFAQVMDKGLALGDWSGFAAREAASKARGKLRGQGLATFLEWTGGNVFEERVTVSVMPDGFIEVYTAVNPMGQGIATTLAQLVVDVFGVSIDQVRVKMGDTDVVNGFGSAGSRSIFTGGSAVRTGAERTIEHAKSLAAKELEASADDIAYAEGRFSVKGTDLGIDLFALAGKQSEQRIFMDSTSAVSGPTWPNGCHVSEVEIDPQTGTLEVVAYASVSDVGRVINPMIVRGQLDGGAVQGMGQALQESFVYDRESGQPITGSLMDYTAPRADLMSVMFKTEMDESTPCKNNPLGVKGVGELGTIGATPCIINAIADALARAGKPQFSAKVQMPVTPLKLWELIAG